MLQLETGRVEMLPRWVRITYEIENEKPTNADAIICVGCGLKEIDGSPSGQTREIARTATNIARGICVPAILLIGDGYRGKALSTEAEEMEHIVLANADIIVHPHTSDTRENALRIAALIRKYGWHKVILVGDSIHMARLLKACRVASRNTWFFPFSSVCKDYGGSKWQLSNPLVFLLYEKVVSVYFRLRGWM